MALSANRATEGGKVPTRRRGFARPITKPGAACAPGFATGGYGLVSLGGLGSLP
jgi:hypothetical protein